MKLKGKKDKRKGRGIIVIWLFMGLLSACGKINDIEEIPLIDVAAEQGESNSFDCSPEGAKDYIVWLLENQLTQYWGAQILNTDIIDLQNNLRNSYEFYLFINDNCQPLYFNGQKPLADCGQYFTENEARQLLSLAEQGYDTPGAAVYLLSCVQKLANSLWGDGVVNIRKELAFNDSLFFPSLKGNLGVFVSSADFDPGVIIYRVVAASPAGESGKEFIVSLQIVEAYFLSDDEIVDPDDYESWSEPYNCVVSDFYNDTIYFLNIDKKIEQSALLSEQFFELIKLPEKIGAIKVLVSYNEKGMHLVGRPATDKVVEPQEYCFLELLVKVKNGTVLRRGPKENYDRITDIAFDERLTAIGIMAGFSDWYYIEYYNESKQAIYYGWLTAADLEVAE